MSNATQEPSGGPLNPNHRVTMISQEHWYKILALVLMKLEVDHVTITAEDVNRVNGKAVVINDARDGLHVMLMSMEEGEALAKAAGGLPS